MSSKKSVVTILWIAIAACESTTALPQMTPTPVALACTEPASVVAAPAGISLAEGIELGNLFVTASWRSSADFQPGYPTKVAIHATDSATLSGRRCADGTPLRFWYREGTPPLGALPASVSKLETTGDLVAQLQPDSSPDESYAGYILFPEAGDYLLTTGAPGSSGDLVLQAVVRVG
jgi:hypothetical protein